MYLFVSITFVDFLLQIFQDKVVQVSNDEFVKQLDISSSEEAKSPKNQDEEDLSLAPSAAQAAVPPLTTTKKGITVVEIPLQYYSPKPKDSISAVVRASS